MPINYSNSIVSSTKDDTLLSYDFVGETYEDLERKVDLFTRTSLDFVQKIPVGVDMSACGNGMDGNEDVWMVVDFSINSPLVSYDLNLLPFISGLDKIANVASKA